MRIVPLLAPVSVLAMHGALNARRGEASQQRFTRETAPVDLRRSNRQPLSKGERQ